MSESPFSQDLRPRPLVVAHRGLSAREAENTLEAFSAAVAVGADGVELDVRLTADGVPIVMHDPLVDRTTDGHGIVRRMTASEIKQLRIATTGDRKTEVPTLAEALALLSGRAMVAVEIKNAPDEPDFDPHHRDAVEATHRVLARAGFVGDVLVASFDPGSIARSREIAPDVPTGLLTIAIDAGAALAEARASSHDWLLPVAAQVFGAGQSLVGEAHAAGVRLGTWTVDEPEPALELMRWGIDAIVTNDAKSIVRARREGFG